MFALCSAAAGLFSCNSGWVDGSYVGVPQYGYIITTSEAACLGQATAAHPDATYLVWQGASCHIHGPSYVVVRARALWRNRL